MSKMIEDVVKETLLGMNFCLEKRSHIVVRGVFTVWIGPFSLGVFRTDREFVWSEGTFIGGVLFADPDLFAKVEELAK